MPLSHYKMIGIHFETLVWIIIIKLKNKRNVIRKNEQQLQVD